MKIIVTSQGAGLDSEVDSRFGRAAAFVLYDTISAEAQTISNDGADSSGHGAGTQAAEMVSRLGADCVITGHCGPKAFRTLSAAVVLLYTGAEGRVSDGVAAFVVGRLKPADSADTP
jgi:predicted Fe-Mo cluster-binding NifX family protein